MTHAQYLLCDKVVSRYDMKTYMSIVDAELLRKEFDENDLIEKHCRMMLAEIAGILGVRLSVKRRTAIDRLIQHWRNQCSISGTGARRASAVAAAVKSIGCRMLDELNACTAKAG